MTVKTISPEMEEYHRNRIALLLAQIRMYEEDLHLEVADALEHGLSLRKLAPMCEVSFNTVYRWKVKGLEARDRRSGGPVVATRQRGKVGGRTGSGDHRWDEPVLPGTGD